MKAEGILPSQAAAQSVKHVKPQKVSADVEGSTSDAVNAPDSGDGTRGVIHLLQEGHFKGVADVRLRINFFDELQSLNSQELKNATEIGFETFNELIEGPVGSLKESGELTEEQLAALNAFLENIQGIQGGFLDDNEISFENLVHNLQGGFDTLLPLFNPPTLEPSTEEQEFDGEAEIPIEPNAIESPAEESPEADPAAPVLAAAEDIPELDTPEIPLYDLFASLRESFQQALENLQSNLSGSQTLPGISEPAGNGKAFEKFMAIYETMKKGDSNEALLIDQLEAVE